MGDPPIWATVAVPPRTILPVIFEPAGPILALLPPHAASTVARVRIAAVATNLWIRRIPGFSLPMGGIGLIVGLLA